MEAIDPHYAPREKQLDSKSQDESYKLLLSVSLEDAMELAIREYHLNPQNATLVLVVG